MKKKTLATFLLALCLTAQLNFCSAEENYDEEITLPIGTNFDLEMEEVTRYEYDGNYVKAQVINGKEQFILQKAGDTIINVVMEEKGQKTELRVLVHIVTEQQFNASSTPQPEVQKDANSKTPTPNTDKAATPQPNKQIQEQYDKAKVTNSKPNAPVVPPAPTNTAKPATVPAQAPAATQPVAPQAPAAAAPAQQPEASQANSSAAKTEEPEKQATPVKEEKQEEAKPLPAIQTDQTFTRPVYEPKTANEAIQYRAEQYAFDVLDLINAERAKYNLRPLSMARDLQAESLLRARELTQRFSHTRPNNTRFYSLMNNPGIIRGENIAAGQTTPAAVVRAWLNSTVHRENILNPQYTELGVGYYETKAAEFPCYWVQLFRG